MRQSAELCCNKRCWRHWIARIITDVSVRGICDRSCPFVRLFPLNFLIQGTLFSLVYGLHVYES